MFLKKLYYFNKVFCTILIIFIAGFYFINYKRGLVVAPIFKYGMYSGVFHTSDTQKVVHLYINDKKIDLTKYDFASRDNLMVSVLNYKMSTQANIDMYEKIEPSFSKIGLSNFMQQDKYTNKVTDEQFMDWYKGYVGHIVGYPVNKIVVYSQLYTWQSDVFMPVSSPKKIFPLGIN